MKARARCVPEGDPPSGGRSLIEIQQSPEPLASADAPFDRWRGVRGEGDHVAQALVVTLGVVVLDKLVDHSAQVMLAERDDVSQALLSDGAHKAPARSLSAQVLRETRN
jgi:hypothetical protein